MTEFNGQNNGRDFSTGRFLSGNRGRPKGANKNPFRENIKFFLKDNWPNFLEWFATLKPDKKIEYYFDLMPYGLSRLQSLSMTDSDGNDLPDKGIDLSNWEESDVRTLIALQRKYEYGGQ